MLVWHALSVFSMFVITVIALFVSPDAPPPKEKTLRNNVEILQDDYVFTINEERKKRVPRKRVVLLQDE